LLAPTPILTRCQHTHRYTADGGGTLDKEEVGELVADLGLALNEMELDDAFQEL
jgi:ligand-binding SRPBCC domain-containing protein